MEKKEYKTDNLIITLDNEGKTRKLQYLQYPLYTRCYREALDAIIRNIDYNKTAIGRKDQEIDFCETWQKYVEPLAKSNIVTFIGDRGSGKTTAINEFCGLLRMYHKLREDASYEPVFSEREENYRFYVLRPVDASVLGDEEDLIEVILASMYQEFRRAQDGRKAQSYGEPQVREIQKAFDETYKDYKNLGRHDEQNILGESTLVKLRSISNSMKTRGAIGELTEKLLNFLNGEEHGRKACNAEAYLVVVIDDLDMNPKSGLKMLEELQKFLQNRRIIILAAIKYEQMVLLSQRHFMDCLMPKYGSEFVEVYQKFEKKANGLSSDYLLKVLPLSNRIYLPGQEQLYKEARVDYERGTAASSDEIKSQWNIKQFVLMRTAEKTGIYYDAKGVKKHFCIPDTVRQLVSYNSFLNALPSMADIISVNGEDRIKAYDQSHERFNQDIEVRMALEHLNNDQLDLFHLIIGRNIERRAEYTVNFLRQWMAHGGKAMRDKVDEQSYCYADLLWGLYELGRKNYSDKPLVHCVLASFTSEMTREYFAYRYSADEAGEEKYRNRLNCLLGRTFGGSWYDKMFCASLDTIQEAFDYSCRELRSKKCTIIIRLNAKEALADELSDIVLFIESVSMLFSNPKNKQRQGESDFPAWHVEMQVGKTEEDGTEDDGTVQLEINGSFTNAVFDLFGFIGKELAGENYFAQVEKFENAVCDAAEACLSGRKIKSKCLKDLRDKIDEKTIRRIKGNKTTAFPYYNLDLSYNVMKRVRRAFENGGPVARNDMYVHLKKVYGQMEECLREESDFYKGLGLNTNSLGELPAFYGEFVESPFIKIFGFENSQGKTKKEDPRGKGINRKEERRAEFLGNLLSSLEDIGKIEEHMEEHNAVE